MTSPDLSDLIERVEAALAKVMPVTINETPDYAEVFFGDGEAHRTQAMTMNPQDWLDLQAAFDALRALQEKDIEHG